VISPSCAEERVQIIEQRGRAREASLVVRLAAEDTKTEQARAVYLTARILAALKALPRPVKGSGCVFANPETNEPWQDVRKMFRRACRRAGLTGIWFHDLRRAFVTNARRSGIPESVVMRM